MVKKTYIIPEMLTVALGTCQMMAQSPTPNVTVNSASNPVDADKVETKEVSDVNVWSEEW